jgi:PilZ domain-containing protein
MYHLISTVSRSCFHRLSAACILPPMPSTRFRDSRRSSRVPLKVIITIQEGPGSLSCEGVTIIVNLHGALIATAIGLSAGTKISVHVHLTDKQSAARVVYVDPENLLHCGIELEKPQNIWGVPLPPSDWEEIAASDVRP